MKKKEKIEKQCKLIQPKSKQNRKRVENHKDNRKNKKKCTWGGNRKKRKECLLQLENKKKQGKEIYEKTSLVWRSS